ncbi:MAG TPA: Ig-like domain-containing protein [Saprospiraceae bacterium]|nr:Ig-like domain-containing protein [Saprospiraceae bacterium]HMQ83384.1 Ig-like domain-containing protein [Saprospiraceae bacterium]
MKMLKQFFYLFLAVGMVSMWSSCKDEDDSGPAALTISGITAAGTSLSGQGVTADLNGATSAKDVALDATITITFSRAVDATTVNTSSVKVSSSAGDAPISVSASGTTATVTLTSPLERGTDYTLSLGATILADDGGALAATSRTFTTEGVAPVVPPHVEDMVAYWPFDGDITDKQDAYNGNFSDAITYGNDRHGQDGSTATFDGDKSIVEVPGADKLMDTDDFTISFWVKTNSNGHVDANGNPAGFFVFGLAAFFGFQFEIPSNFGSCKLAASYELADGTKVSEDLWFPGDGKDKDNGGWQGWDFVADLTGSGGVASLIQDKWAHIICTYNATEKQGRMYINGELMKSFDFDLWPENDAKRTVVGMGYRGVAPETEPVLAFGFIQSRGGQLWDAEPWGGYDFPTANHFKGDLDDIRVFHAAFDADDAAALYNAEKP